MKVAQYLISLFKTAPFVVFSWGFSNPIAIKNGISFRTNGFKHKGLVEIVYNEGKDLFEVRLIKRGNIIKQVEDVYVDMLIDLIDGLVERTENYKEDVEKWLCEAF